MNSIDKVKGLIQKIVIRAQHQNGGHSECSAYLQEWHSDASSIMAIFSSFYIYNTTNDEHSHLQQNSNRDRQILASACSNSNSHRFIIPRHRWHLMMCSYYIQAQIMHSDPNLRLKTGMRARRKESNATTLSSNTQNRARAKSFQDQPFPKDPARRLQGRQLKERDISDQQEESGVVLQEEEGEAVQQKRTLPHFVVMSDHGEFAERGRPKQWLQRKSFDHRCRSVELLQVKEEKREEDQRHLGRSKLSQFKDRNQFGQRKSLQLNSMMDLEGKEGHFSAVPERIPETQAEECTLKLTKREKSSYSSELQKLRVDEIDQHRRSREEQGEIEEIVQEQRQQEEPQNVRKLRLSLQKLQHEAEYLSKSKEEDLRVSPLEEKHQEETSSSPLIECRSQNGNSDNNGSHQ